MEDRRFGAPSLSNYSLRIPMLNKNLLNQLSFSITKEVQALPNYPFYWLCRNQAMHIRVSGHLRGLFQRLRYSNGSTMTYKDQGTSHGAYEFQYHHHKRYKIFQSSVTCNGLSGRIIGVVVSSTMDHLQIPDSKMTHYCYSNYLHMLQFYYIFF